MASRSVVGLDIGTSGVRAAQVALTKDGPVLERFAQIALAPGAVRDAEVLFPDSVAEAIKSLWATAKFTTKDVVLGISNQKVAVRQVDLPYLPPQQMREALPFQVADFVPMALDQAQLDYFPVTDFVDENGTHMLRMLLVAATRDTVDNLVSSADLAGLTPVMVDLTPFALLRSLVGPVNSQLAAGMDAGAGEALVDIGASTTNIVVHQGGIPRFVRILPQGGNAVTQAVAERIGVDFAEADSIKMLAAMPQQASIGVGSNPAVPIINQFAAQFVDEVRGTLDYYMAQAGSGRLRRVVVTGGGTMLGGLVARMGSALRMPVEPARTLQILHVDRAKVAMTDEQLALSEPLLAVPVGLALGVM